MEKKHRSFFSSPLSFNYICFCIYFLLVAALHITHVLLIQPESWQARCFFSFYSCCETFLEVIGLVLLGSLTRQFLSRWIYHLFIVLAFILLFSHFIDFLLIRLM